MENINNDITLITYSRMDKKEHPGCIGGCILKFGVVKNDLYFGYTAYCFNISQNYWRIRLTDDEDPFGTLLFGGFRDVITTDIAEAAETFIADQFFDVIIE